MVSDGVWLKLDRNAGRLSRPATVRLWLAILLVLALFAGAGEIVHAGFFAPRLAEQEGYGGFRAEVPAARVFHFRFAVRSDNTLPVKITGFGRSGPGLVLTRIAVVNGALPVTLRRGEIVEFDLWYQVTDCATVPSVRWPVPVRVSRFFGTQTVLVTVQWIGGDGLEWQRSLSQSACQVTRPT